MKRNHLFTSLLTLGLLCAGCVSKKELVNLQADYDSLKENCAKLEAEKNSLNKSFQEAQIQLAESRTAAKGLEERLSEAQINQQEMRNNYAVLQSSLDKSIQHNSQESINISKLVDEINASNQYIKQLVNAKTKSDSLNVVLTNNLTRSLSREELKEVDVKVLKGVVYISLADNMLYKSGSYEINERAGETLSKIAKIITDYKDYEVLVEGNTDNVPISRPNIRNNWDLSALRASSVVQALQNQYGVDPKRLSAAGRGEYNPITDNDTALGKQRNRRTQIIITPKLDEFMELIEHAPESETPATAPTTEASNNAEAN
ncbi:MAG: OmpA family protein [Bacteroides sp.]|nr:OmpA family protein [Bacteroides sp.]MBQ8225707.1 OmpA family protein [Bacteroides sp.]